MKTQSGFTLIELIMVIVILGILAATAIPRYVNLQGSAQTAALQGVLGAVQSTIAINYAAQQLNQGADISDCDDVAPEMQGGLPSGYSITDSGSACSLTGPGGSVGFELL